LANTKVHVDIHGIAQRRASNETTKVECLSQLFMHRHQRCHWRHGHGRGGGNCSLKFWTLGKLSENFARKFLFKNTKFGAEKSLLLGNLGS